MTPLWLPPGAVVPFVMDRCGLARDFGDCRTMGVFDGAGRMVAGVVFHNWNPEAGVIEVSAASDDPRWATRGVMQAVMGYCFAAGCQAVVARTAEDNMRTRRLWKAMGAQEHIIPRLRGRTASDALLVLTDDAWAQSKFARTGNGKTQASRAA